MSRDRVYSEQEVAQIIRRAAEITESLGPAAYTPGVTQSELQRIATEVGISPEALRQALSEGSIERSQRRGLLHLTEEFERVVEGELEPDQYDLIVEGLKMTSGPGQGQIA